LKPIPPTSTRLQNNSNTGTVTWNRKRFIRHGAWKLTHLNVIWFVVTVRGTLKVWHFPASLMYRFCTRNVHLLDLRTTYVIGKTSLSNQRLGLQPL
jgi:hypothetical protein